ncbi:hypothetical protein [Ramlibacter algicola]|uniref:Plasmid stabilization protein n=1 Tax=Ramlibacter algicola TaxID=2795217 RepID=A0A934Q1U0_9BURK|nr:hypothetical protein [Ramlibacter algicola]MBK0392712.1 hypothetical protein [Ramlibacter algicola]
MPRKDKSAETGKQKHQAGAIAKGHEKQGVAHPEAEARGWAAASKLHSGGKEMAASRRKLPSGPLGGSGRKTNVSRSS